MSQRKCEKHNYFLFNNDTCPNCEMESHRANTPEKPDYGEIKMTATKPTLDRLNVYALRNFIDERCKGVIPDKEIEHIYLHAETGARWQMRNEFEEIQSLKDQNKNLQKQIDTLTEQNLILREGLEFYRDQGDVYNIPSKAKETLSELGE